MKKISHLSTISSVIVLAFIVPQIAFAAWWNPISWFGGWNFFHRADTQTQVLENRVKELEKKLEGTATSTSVIATTTKAIAPIKTKAVEIPAPKKVPPVIVPVQTVAPVQPAAPVLLDSSASQKDTGSVSSTDSWSDLETKHFAEATQKGWAYLTITNDAGAQRFYRSENGVWIQKNTLSEAQQSYQTSPQSNTATSNSQPPPNTTPCNGTNWTACSAGKNFVCPADGGRAYCQSPQQTFSQPYITQPPSNTVTPPPAVITVPKVSPPIPPAPTLAQQNQACQDKYTKDSVPVEASKLSAYNYYTNIINTTPSDDYFAERGLTSSSQRTAADAQRSAAQSAIVSAMAQYNARMSDLKAQLQSCLDNIVPAQ